MTNKQKEALSKFYFNVALLSLGSFVFDVINRMPDQEAIAFESLKIIGGLTLTVIFLILGLILLKGNKND